MTLPHVTLRGGVHVDRALLTETEIDSDFRALAVPNPAHAQALRAGNAAPWRHPTLVSSLFVGDAGIVYPMGAAHVYRPRLRGKSFELVDERPCFAAEPLPYRGELLGFQRAGLDELLQHTLLQHTTGGIEAPCGSGKGEMLVTLAGELGLPTLVVVSTQDQAEELRARFLKRLGVEAGLIGGGTFDVRRITVALIQSLDPATLRRIEKCFEVLVVDEGHHGAAESYRDASFALHVRRRYWFSATPNREDGLSPFIAHHFGPIRHTVSRAELVAAGRSIEPRFTEIATCFTFEYRDRADWTPMLAALVGDEARNTLIADTVAIHSPGHVSAVLTGRVDHADVLREMLAARGLRAFSLTGETKKAERKRIIEAARARELDVIVGTQLLDEGIDIAALARVFLVFPAVAEGRLVQRVGRALRVCGGKPEPIVFDFVDREVGVLRHQAKRRRAVFARQWPSSQRIGCAA